MKSAYKGFTLIEITLVMVLIAILLAITTPLVSSVVTRNDVGGALESLYNGLLRAQQLSKNNYQNSQWRVCLDNTDNQYTITSGTCSDPTNAEIIKISSNITISSEQTLDILFKAINGEPDYNNAIIVNLSGGGVSKSILINPSGVIDKEANTTSSSTTTTPSIVTDGLVLNLDAGNIGSYPGTGTTWTDLSGNGNNGTLVNGVGYNSANGGSLVFDGVNDYMIIDGNPDVDGIDNFSVFAFFNKTSSQEGSIFSKVASCPDISPSPGNNRSIQLSVNTNGDLSFRYPIGGGGFGATGPAGRDGNVVTTTNIIPINTWIFVAVTFDSNNVILYKDGIEVYRESPTVSTIFKSDQFLRIGSSWTYCSGTNTARSLFTGSIPFISFYNKTLTPEEIQQNFNATKDRFGL